MLVARQLPEIMATEIDPNDVHRDGLHNTELGLSAVHTPGVALLLSRNRRLFGSHSVMYGVPQQDYMIAVGLAVDAHAIVV